MASSLVEVKGQIHKGEQYESVVGMNSLLYRGRIERRYAYRYSGTYFAYHDKYVKGEVYFNKRLYTEVLVNLNSHRDRVSVRHSENQMPVILDRNYLEWFKMGSRLFINVDEGEYDGLESGYYEVIYEDSSRRLLKKIVKEYKEVLERSVVEIQFTPKIEYYVAENGTATAVKGKKGFIGLYPARKKEIKRIFRDAPVVVRDDKDRLFKLFMEGIR